TLPQGQAYLLVIVFDVDSNSLDDTVDVIVVHILPSSLRRWSHVETFSGTFGFGSLSARYRVDCDKHFFGEDCSVLCVDTDSADGHYECDRYGNQECLPGYQNA
ncbi:Delta-like protein B, partial [Geodia barretti]